MTTKEKEGLIDSILQDCCELQRNYTREYCMARERWYRAGMSEESAPSHDQYWEKVVSFQTNALKAIMEVVG